MAELTELLRAAAVPLFAVIIYILISRQYSAVGKALEKGGHLRLLKKLKVEQDMI